MPPSTSGSCPGGNAGRADQRTSATAPAARRRTVANALALGALLAGCERAAESHARAAAQPAHDAGTHGAGTRDAVADPLTRSEHEGRWGFVDSAGAWAIPATYAWAESFSEGLAAVRLGDRWGFVDRSGRLAVPARYRDADGFSEGLAAVRDEDGWRYIDPSGSVRIAGPFEQARPFRCNEARVRVAELRALGRRTHGTYLRTDGDFPTIGRARGRAFSALIHPEPGSDADGLDDIALGVLYADADALTASAGDGGGNPFRRPHWRLREPQWEEHVWQAIDPHGAVISASEVRSCASTAPSPPGDPSDLRTMLEALRPGADRTAFFRRADALGARAVPVLREALADRRAALRLNALEALVRLGPRAASAVPTLTATLADPSGDVFLFAAWALGRIGQPAASAAEALMHAHARRGRLVEAALAAVAHDDPAVRAFLERSATQRRTRGPAGAARALVDRHDPGALPAVLALLGGAHRSEALAMLADLGPSARSAAPRVRAEIEAALQYDQEAVFESGWATEHCPRLQLALRTLWRITSEAAPVVRYVEAQLRPGADSDRFDRCDPWALQVAVEMGPAAAPLRSALERYARIDTDTREAAQAVLRAIGAP